MRFTPQQLGMDSEIVRQAALNVNQRESDGLLALDLDEVERWFRAMVEEVTQLEEAARSVAIGEEPT